MTNPTPHRQVPEALRLAEEISNLVCSSEAAAKTIAAAADELCRLHVENASLRAQQPASPPAEQQGITPETGNSVPAQGAAITSESGAVYAELPEPTASIGIDDAWHEPAMRDFADRTHALRKQAAPKAAPGVGNSGFDHKTAADLLNNKTVSDEAVRKFVATSRWAHDEKAALSATLLAMHGVLTSREAEIALLKKALMEAMAAPQQEAQEPTAFIHWPINEPPRLVWYSQKALNDAILKTHEDGYKPDVKLYTAPQPAPAPLSDEAVRDAEFEAVRKKLCALPRFSFLSDGYGVRRVPDKAGSWIAFDAAHALFDPVAVDAALAAQGGKA